MKTFLLSLGVLLAMGFGAFAGGEEFVTEGRTIYKKDKDGNVLGVMAVDDFSHLPAPIKSPALIAIENDDVEALRQLLEEGLDPNSAAYLEDINSKPLLWKTHCKPRMIRLLLEYGADQEITHRTNRGRMTFGEKTDASIASMKASKDDSSLVHYERDMKCLIAMKQALSN